MDLKNRWNHLHIILLLILLLIEILYFLPFLIIINKIKIIFYL